jgi:hypothetical protein
MLRKIFELKSEEKTEICNLYSSSNIIRTNTSRRIGDMGHIERTKKTRCVHTSWWKILREHLAVNEMMILKLVKDKRVLGYRMQSFDSG